MNKKNYIAGLYMRLSKDDERHGESLSIENQRGILRKYAEERGFEIHDEYIDDGVSGTTFDRPQVQRLLDDAKTGVINTIIVKDLSRFGRNYIEVGQYIDYVFPAFGIRFIAIQDNVDTENRDSGAMEMMPIMNVFNEWHAANTSKKIRAVKKANALAGIYNVSKVCYGYVKSNDKKHTPIIDEEVAHNVVRIFELYASGLSAKKISEIFNEEGIACPRKYAFEKFGHELRANEHWIWCPSSINIMLRNMVYIGHMPQLMSSSVSYKNHKRTKKDKSEWIITYNTHEPIISQELWDKVQARRNSVAQGRTTFRTGYTHPLSGFLICADCGCKMKQNTTVHKGKRSYSFDCGDHKRYGKALCFSHHIMTKDLEAVILDDIRTMAQRIVLDEEEIRNDFIKHNAELADASIKKTKKDLKLKQKRVEELDKLIQSIYEDKVKGKMEEDVCFGFIDKYSAEKKTLLSEIKTLEQQIIETETTKQSADDFIKAIKKYLDVPELTREMCYELIDRVIVGGLPKVTGKERTIEIVYKVDIVSVLRYKLQQ